MTVARTHCALIALLTMLLAPAAPAQQAATGPQRWESDIRKFEEMDRKSPPAPGGVLFVGSSSIVKWTTLRQDFPDLPIIQRGFGGSDLADTLYFADRIVLPYKPRLIVVYAGDNDLAHGRTVEQVTADWDALVKRVRAALPETRIAFISVKPSLARWKLIDQIRAVNDHVRAVAAKDPKQLYIDVYTPMLGPDGMPRKELLAPDGLHMNAEGYVLWKKVVADAIK